MKTETTKLPFTTMPTSHILKATTLGEIGYLTHHAEVRKTYWATFGKWPCTIEFSIKYPKTKKELISWAEKEGYQIEAWAANLSYQDDAYSDRMAYAFCHKDKEILIVSRTASNGSLEVNLYCSVDEWVYAHKASETIKQLVGSEYVTGKINLMAMEHGEFVLTQLELSKPELNMTLNYGEGFEYVHKDIMGILNSPASGLILLHGISGSGKSTYIYHLVHDCPKRMIYIPNNLVQHMASPDFVQFLIGEAKDAVLIVEDAEKVLLERGKEGDTGVSTLLNLTDGILGRLVKCKVICTFNTERASIDQALLRKGRLRKEHEFTKLSADHANRLLAHLGKTRRTTEPLTLAEIYNEEGGRDTTPTIIGFAKTE